MFSVSVHESVYAIGYWSHLPWYCKVYLSRISGNGYYIILEASSDHFRYPELGNQLISQGSTVFAQSLRIFLLPFESLCLMQNLDEAKASLAARTLWVARLKAFIRCIRSMDFYIVFKGICKNYCKNLHNLQLTLTSVLKAVTNTFWTNSKYQADTVIMVCADQITLLVDLMY